MSPITMPSGACDCHFHIFEAARYRYAEARHYTPQDATLDDYLALCNDLSIQRSVLIHPTVFGGDHLSFEDVLRSQGHRMRGVAVVAPDTPDEDIARWHALGARGTRITTIFSGDVNTQTIRRIVDKIKPFGWHVQLLVDVAQRPDLVAQVLDMGATVVVDHMGHHDAATIQQSAGFANLLSQLSQSGIWLKLSAPYRLSADCISDVHVQSLAERYLRVNPDRLVWGTDWPHPSCSNRIPTSQQLLTLMTQWLPDEVIRKKVLADNPARLYWN
ncbi:amidohydrolase family protein [Diaphorobacter sp. HDW4A]|uniref:amidohydrolase family protein n=1 Tax=Diaphorobacter sp. HDW4A TaxID=2714924 RepID=UPI00140C6DE0|nr:amidohydrolase family protein [Diaphorobacter sp. HDW4A]QIL79977.1 amidohydrolase family protein [Diaphorobacter sp. HDW4A]